MDSISLFDRIAMHSGYDSWEIFVESAKKRPKEFKIPLYIPLSCANMIFQKIKDQNMKLVYRDKSNKLFLRGDAK